MFNSAKQPHSQPKKKENHQVEIEDGEVSFEKKEFGRELFQKVKEFIKRDWEETLKRRKEKKKGGIIQSAGKEFITGLIIVATLSTGPGKKAFVELANGLRKWNPGNLLYRVPDAWEYVRKGVSQREEAKETQTSMTEGEGTKFKMGERTFWFNDSVYGFIRAFQKIHEKNGDAKIEITNENTKKLLAFEYEDIKPPKDPRAFREFVSFYAKRTLEKRRTELRIRFLVDGVSKGTIKDPLAIQTCAKLELLWMNPEIDYAQKEKDKIILFRALEENLLKEGVSIGYPDSLLPYEHNPGPQDLEEFLAVAQTILNENLGYDPAVESWLGDRSKLKEGEGNYLVDMYSANGTPIDVLLEEKKSGVCRHYADAFAAVCRELQQMFPSKFENVYVTTSTSIFRLHKYNTVFVVESPDVLRAISYEPQDGGVGEFHNTPAFEILESMYARNYISKEDFYGAVTEYFSHRGVESREDVLAFLDRLKGDGSELARAAGKGVLDAMEREFDVEAQQEKNPRLRAHVLYSKHKFLQEVEEYRNAFGYN